MTSKWPLHKSVRKKCSQNEQNWDRLQTLWQTLEVCPKSHTKSWTQLCLHIGKGAGLPGTSAEWENHVKMADNTQHMLQMSFKSTQIYFSTIDTFTVFCKSKWCQIMCMIYHRWGKAAYLPLIKTTSVPFETILYPSNIRTLDSGVHSAQCTCIVYIRSFGMQLYIS